MSSIPYSRFLFGRIPWYSILIVTGMILAILLACREERRKALPKDTVIDLALWLIPCGIIGARIYYVVFAWDQFRDDLWSVFRIWEGGIAIYGGIIAGLLVLLIFCRVRRLPPLLLCDVIVPGLALAQSIGRWGNWFNIEAYGLAVTVPELCFFPFALQVPADGYAWHLATFFYESLWDFLIFLFLIIAGRRLFLRKGDPFFFYVFLYASGRLVIEGLRLDSLYAASSVRISQLLSVLLCAAVILRYILLLRKQRPLPASIRFCVLPAVLCFSAFAVLLTLPVRFLSSLNPVGTVILLSVYALMMILCLFAVYRRLRAQEVRHADDKA